MANKTYAVIKDGEMIRELKTLAAARKLADTEGADVICDGETVYHGSVAGEDDLQDASAVEEADKDVPVVETVTLEKYRLSHLMNVRTAPSIEAKKVGLLPTGTVVDVLAVENDWLNLADGTFVLYGGGKFADRI